MPTTHPTAAALLAYGQGRLGAAEMSEIEAHLAECASCCEALAATPDDTLLLRAREAATSGFRAREQTVATKTADVREIPQPLRDHPRYRVLGLIGAGGMGAVYKAEHRLMERLVALKVINPALVSSPAALERFEREVKTAAKLSHPNIVAAHDAEQAGDLHFLVMEFVEGMSLDRLVASTGPLPPHVAAGLIYQAAMGLQHAHERGMIHRDIKPHNLMRTRDGVLKILDFGLARLATQAWQSAADDAQAPDRPENATRAGAVLGTPDYIAPEQAVDAHLADIRADIYSLGCTLYFLLTGEPPFAGGTVVEKLHAHQTLAPAPIRLRRPEVPEELALILERMLAKNPADRFARPADLAKALKPLAQARPAPGAAATGDLQTAKPLPAPTMGVVAAPAPLAAQSIQLDSFAPAAFPSVRKAPPVSSASPNGARRTAKQNMLLVAGGIFALLALIAAGIWAATGNDDEDPGNRKRNSNASRVVTNANENDSLHSAENRSAPLLPAIQAGQHQVLMLLPQSKLFYPDYENFKNGLPNSVKLVTAATIKEPVGLYYAEQGNSEGKSVTPDLELSDQLTAQPYSAIVFVGATSNELCNGLDRAQVARLLREFKAEGKPICALCAGQHVLASHNLLTADRRVAGGQFAEQVPDFRNCAAKRQGWGVVRDGNLITGAEATDGKELAQTVAAAIGAK